MLRFFKTRFMNLKIRQKIIVCMLVLVILTALLVGTLCSTAFASQFTAQVTGQADDTVSATVTAMQANINTLYRGATYLVSGSVFDDIFRANRGEARDPEFLRHYNQLHLLFTSFLRGTDWADSIALLCSNGTLYSTYEAGWNYTPAQFASEASQTSIAWLPARETPLSTGTAQVIPVCFPLRYNQGLTFCNGQKPDMTLIIYLNADRVALSMEQMNRAAFSRVYLADSDGFPLSIRQTDTLYGQLSGETFREQLRGTDGRSRFDVKLNGEAYFITSQPVNASGLRFVSAVSYQPILDGIHRIQQVTLGVVLAVVLLALALAAALSSTLTTPIHRLLTQVEKVRQGNYALQPVTKYGDEMRAMDAALCDMAQTIRGQIADIHRTEALRRKAEMDALTEQMNPHFLYNTLDCIHWEILSGHQQNAAAMVESLGAFLRLSLNHGRELLSLPESIAHTQQYINIINCRFGSQIRFTYTLAPELQRLQLPKMILQPLAENAILHGFGGQDGDPAVSCPTIRITTELRDGCAVLTVEDNGSGFDPDEMARVLGARPSDSGHVGLYNLYERLCGQFGPDTRISFSSIPYYRSTVVLSLPWTDGAPAATPPPKKP